MLRAIIIDDESDAREKLEFLLRKHQSATVEVAAVCKNGTEGLLAIAEHKPDLLFLDVEMPGMTGFDMLRKYAASPQASSSGGFDVVFTTAFDHYAIKAIKFAAIDYLLKPIDLDMLNEAINRVVEKHGSTGSAERVQQLMEHTRAGAAHENITVPSKNGFELVPVKSVIWCQAVGYYAMLYLEGGRELLATRTLKEFEEMLEGNGFVRIHHSHMINLAHMAQYLRGEGGQVVMKNGVTLDVSRRKKEELMAKLGR